MNDQAASDQVGDGEQTLAVLSAYAVEVRPPPVDTATAVFAVLSAHAEELRRRGVLHAALFGSFARGEATINSDIDVLIELDPNVPMGVFDYVAIQRYIGGLFSRRVDVVNRKTIKTAIRPSIIKDARYAF